jgi:hypothetical protein
VPKLTLDLRHLIRQCPECSRRFSPEAVFCPFDGGKLVEAPRPDEKLDPLLGQTLDGRYALDGVLGEGGMGTVYRARHVALGRSLAVKVLRADLAKEADLAARFLQEAQATAAIKHPNIVSITDFGRLPDQRPYFVMELLSGRTLGSLIKAGGALPPRDAARIAIGVATGLEAAHAAGVIHRDLKPENVFLLDEKGADLRVVDFGAAMIVGGSRLTKAGVVFGTPHYMSPEQAAGKAVDHRADIYALGIILYEMITGRVPFEGDTYMGVLTQHMFVAPRPPSELVPALIGKLGALEAVVLRALEKDPAARFSSMAELADAIGSALEARGAVPSWPSPARPSAAPPRGIADDLELPTMGEIRERLSATEVQDRRARARRAAFAVVAVAAVIAFAGLGVRVYSTSRAEPAATTAPVTATVTATAAATVTATATATAAASSAPTASATMAASATASAEPTPRRTHPPPRTTASHKSSGTAGGLGPDPFEH